MMKADRRSGRGFAPELSLPVNLGAGLAGGPAKECHVMTRRYYVLVTAVALLGLCPQAGAQAKMPESNPTAGAAEGAPTRIDPLKDPRCQRKFEQFFGPEGVKVDMSASKLDDGAFAKKLSHAATEATDDTDFQVYLYDKACIFGLRVPTSYELVQQALTTLDSLAPRSRNQWDEYRLALFRKMYGLAKPAGRKSMGEDLVVQLIAVGNIRAEAGRWAEAAELYRQAVKMAELLKSSQKDRAAAKLARATHMNAVGELCRKLVQDPDNAKLRMSAIDAYLGLLDSPAGARALLNPSVGQVYCTYVPLAAKGTRELASAVLMELGNWYVAMARKAPPTTRPTLARRAASYYRAYLRKLSQQGATVAAVQEARATINAALKQAGLASLPNEVLFRDPVVQKAFDRAVDWLWSRQAADGAWVTHTEGDSHDYGNYNTRSTATALAALLAGGASITDSRVVKAVRWLEPTVTRQTEGVAFRCLVWMEVQKRKPGAARRMLSNDVTTMVRATRNGSYGETVTSWNYARIQESWPGPVGVDAGERAGLKAPRSYWQLVAGFWSGRQRADGDISPSSKVNAKAEPNTRLTVNGAGCLALALNRLHGPDAVKKLSGIDVEPLTRVLDWMDKNFASLAALRPENTLARDRGDLPSHRAPAGEASAPEHLIFSEAFYMLSNIGLVTGREKLGQVKWWADGSRYLAGLQNTDGSWGGIIDTARVVLFLTNGYSYEQANQADLPALLTGAAAAATAPATTRPAEPEPLSDFEARRLLRSRESTLKSRLRNHPENQAVARQLVRLYVLELKEPQKALAYADRTGNYWIKRYIGLLSTAPNTLGQDEALGLADWHLQMADGATDDGRTLALTRAVGYYRAYLARNPGFASDAEKAKTSLERATDALSAMSGP